jgi:hypothetical protein
MVESPPHRSPGRFPPQDALDLSTQLIRGAGDGLVHGGSLIGDCDRLASFQPGFHHATYVLLATFIVALVAKVYLYARDVFAYPAQGAFDYATCLGSHRFIAIDVTVCIDLDFHPILLF